MYPITQDWKIVFGMSQNMLQYLAEGTCTDGNMQLLKGSLIKLLYQCCISLGNSIKKYY